MLNREADGFSYLWAVRKTPPDKEGRLESPGARGQTTSMQKYAFLSDEWVGEAKRIYAEAGAGGAIADSTNLAPVRVNLIVTDAPFSSAPVDAHVDTSAGRIDIDVGHLQQPDVTISLGYDTARSLFVQGDVQSVLQAFLGGRIKVDGDLSKLLDPRSGIWPSPSASAAPRPGAPRGGVAGAGAGGGSGEAMDTEGAPESAFAQGPAVGEDAYGSGVAGGGVAGGGVAGGGVAGGGVADGEGSAGPAGPGQSGLGQQGFGFGGPEARDVAIRLQEITE